MTSILQKKWTRRLVVAAIAVVVGSMAFLELSSSGAMPLMPSGIPKPDRSGYADVNGIRMWYGIYNPDGGDPVVLLHGGLGSSADWREQIPALVGKHKVIVADSRGQGRSTRTDAPITYDLMASDVLALMDYLKIPRAAIGGWSDGGIIGLDIAIHHPERLSKLFTYGANFNVEGLIPTPAPSKLWALKSEIESLVDEHEKTKYEVIALWRSEPDFTPEELGSIRVPTLIADGEREEAVKPEHARELARLIPGATLVMLPNAGHAGLIDDPDDFNEAMTKFLDGAGA